MVRRFTLLVLLSVSLAAPVFARGNLKELTVPLKFAPQEAVHESSAALPPGMLDQTVEVRVEDARKLGDPLVIGSGTGGDDKPFPVHADREVRGYVQEVLAVIGKAWALKLDGPASRILLVRITAFSIDESNKAVGSMYSGDVNLAFTLTDTQGHTLASGVGSGSTHRYGRAHSPENVNEVLSDALKEAYANVLSDSALQTSWADGKPSGNAAQAAPRESVEERLRKLEDLYKKGLITKDEYQKRREEILKDT